MLIFDLIKRFLVLNPKCEFFVGGGGRAKGVDTGDIGHSLRFRSAASAVITKTIGPGGTPTQCCLSMWVKRSKLGAVQQLFQGRQDGNNQMYFQFNASDQLELVEYASGVQRLGKVTSAIFRDVTSWIHLFVKVDTTEAAAEDRFKVYVNGVRITAWATNTNTFPQSSGVWWGSNNHHNIGASGAPGSQANFFEGYVARVCFGYTSSATVNDFGYLNTEINEWVSKSQSAVKAVVDAGGTNSFMLDFDDPNFATYNVGKDYSSKGNHWTPNNFSLTAGTSYDRMLDVPGNSFATWNPLFPTTNTISNGNLRGALAASVNAGYGIRSTIPMVSGKYEAEFVPAASADSWSYVGVCPASFGISDVSIVGSNAVLYRAGNGNKNVSGTATAYGASWTTEAIRVAVDMDARTVTFYKAGVPQGSISLPSGTENYIFVMANGNATTFTADANFGQQPITLDSGYKALCQRNMPDPAILNPEKHFDVDIYTGTGSAINRTGFLLQPDLIWIKGRQSAYSHAIFDSVRGVTKVLNSNTTDADYTESAGAGLTAFNADGYSLGTNGADASTNVNSQNFVTWLWKAGGAAVTNNAGSISSQVSANVEAGFSIVTYTGNLSSAGTATVGHGLGQAPGLIISKSRNNAGGDSGQWVARHKYLASANHYLRLNTTDTPVDGSANGSMSASTSTVFSTNWTSGMNSNGGNFVAYCFAEIPGFSKIFSYTGNGAADGPFVHCGFKPKFILLKNASAAGNGWIIHDAVRNTYNVMDLYLQPNTSSAEGAAAYIDAVSNGFKVRTANADANGSTNTIIGIAFADVPAKYALAR